ncbi:YoaK family protein [Flavobacterium sp. 25HG05S-40]|uniref:YoaK family protein n=1 Tax=Flavobacterium sp. 25HG05S-40 TaxID=3458682 RepID=UPI004044F2BB
MFTHQGKSRTLSHNLRIASLLSFVAGIVNVAGFLAVAKLTTNVTGHFAFFVDEVFKLNFWEGFVYFLYIFFFFMGSFVSSYLVELISQKTERNIYVFPTSIEILILLLLGIFGGSLLTKNPNVIACSLLFAMGLQNSLVTKISNATVRTTHLTGLFTDLGIELSQLFFFKELQMKQKLYASIKLRLIIISFFFIGGIIGGIFYVKIKLKVLIIAAVALAIGLIYDNIKLKILLLNRKYNH